MSQSLLRSGQAGLDLLIEELAAKLQSGEPIDMEVYLRDHADHADELRKLWPTLEALARLGPSLNPDGPVTLTAEEQMSNTLGDFRIIREVGRGGMGIVYEAEQTSLKRHVALKVLPFAGAMDSRQLQRFKNESLAAAQLHHTNIVPVYYVGCERGVHFYAMQYIEGQSLADAITEVRRVARPESSQGVVLLKARPSRTQGMPSLLEAIILPPSPRLRTRPSLPAKRSLARTRLPH
jgi:hypothetical protein